MADLFGYTPTQETLSPRSSTTNVRPQAGNAFKALAGIYDSINQLKKQQADIEAAKVQQESAEISQQMQTQRMINAGEADLKKQLADEQKAEAKKALAKQKTEVATDVALRERNYTASIQAIQSNPNLSDAERVQSLRAFSSQYVAENDALLSNLPDEVFTSVKDKVFSNSETAIKNYNDYLATVDKTNYETDLAIKTDSFINIVNIEDMRASYQTEMQAASASGVNARDFGDLQTDYIISNFRTALNSENLEKTHDYTQLDNAQAFMLKYYGVDKRNRVKVEGFLKEIDDIRTRVDAAVVDNIKQASELQNKPFFDGYLTHATKNGAISPDEANMLRAQYIKDGASKTVLERREAEKLVANASTGVPDYVVMPSGGVKSNVKSLVKDKLVSALDSGTLEPAFVDEIKRVDSATWKSAANADVDRKLRKIKDLALKEASEKDPAKAQELAQQRNALFAGLQKNLKYIDSDLDRGQSMMLEAYKTVVLSGNFENIQKAYELIGDPATVPNIKDKTLIDKIEEDVPLDMRQEAMDSAAILTAAGFSTSEAYEIVSNTHAYETYGDMSFEMSKKAHDIFVGNNISSKSVPYFEEALRKEASLGTSNAALDKREAILKVFEGENPRMSMSGNNLRFENDDGAMEELLMSPETWKGFKKELDALYDIDNPAGKGLSRWAYENSGNFAVKASELGNAVADLAELPLAGGYMVAEALDFGAIGESLSATTDSINTMFDDWLYKGVPFAEAFDNMQKRNKVIDDTFNTNYETDKAEIWNKALEAGERGAKVWAGGLQQSEEADLMQELKDAGSAIDDGLKWLGSGLQAPEEADFGKEVSNLKNSVFDAVTSGFRKLVDFVTSEAEASSALPVMSNVDGQMLFNTTNFNKNIGRIAEGRHGYDAQAETYTPMLTNDAAEKNKADSDKSSDIGYGHKITKEEWASGEIHGIPFFDLETKKAIPLTEADVIKILDSDMSQNLAGALPNWNKKIKEAADRTFDDINPQAQAVLASLAFNVGSSKAKQWEDIFSNYGLYYPSMDPEETAQFAYDLRRNDNGVKTKGTDNRVMKELVSAGLIKDQATYDAVVARLPKHNEYPTFASTK